MTGSAPAGSSQARELGLAPGRTVWLDGPSSGWSLTDPPAGLLMVSAHGSTDTVVGFFRTAAALEDRLPALAERIFPHVMLWVAWPRCDRRAPERHHRHTACGRAPRRLSVRADKPSAASTADADDRLAGAAGACHL